MDNYGNEDNPAWISTVSRALMHSCSYGAAHLKFM